MAIGAAVIGAEGIDDAGIRPSPPGGASAATPGARVGARFGEAAFEEAKLGIAGGAFPGGAAPASGCGLAMPVSRARGSRVAAVDVVPIFGVA